ncbi:MAG: SPFH domain-containing protein [Candidatus Nanohaloarchaea archaeon]|nr:SPFH domain-containing protein [Candidatus Nanohaloarchaea archaeon]
MAQQMQQMGGSTNIPSASSSSGTVVKLVLSFILLLILGTAGSMYAGMTGAIGGAVLAGILYFSIVINQEYERAVVFRLGSYSRVLGPGFNLKIPFLEWIQNIDYRVKTVNVKPQKVLTKDNVTVTVDAIVFYKVKRESEEIKKAVLEVEDFNEVTVNYGQTMLRAMIGKKELDEILQNRDEIADELRKQLDTATNDFGVHIRDVEIQDVSIPNSMERAMASEAEAERDRRAQITKATGELQAAARTRIASDILGDIGYNLRALQTLDEVGKENSTVIPIPAGLLPGGDQDRDMDEQTQQLVDSIRDQLDIDQLMNEAASTVAEQQQNTSQDDE